MLARLGPPRAVLVLAVLVRLPAVLADRHLTFDDGVYGASARALRDGGLPFRDVFSSQGPLFLPLVWLADLVGLHTLDGPRVLSLASAVVVVVATHRIARHWCDRWGAGLAALVVALSGSVLVVSGPLASGGPAIALSLAALAVALDLDHDATLRRAVAIGVLVGAALSVKNLLVAPTVVPIALLLLGTRRPRLVATAAGSAIATALAAALPWGLARVWDQSVTYHLEVHTERTPLANVAKMLATLADRDTVVLALGAVAAAGLLIAGPGGPRQRRPESPAGGRQPGADRLLASWLVTTVVVIVASAPLWRPHMAHLVPPLALFAARWRPAKALVVALLALSLPFQVAHVWAFLDPDGYRGDAARVEAALRAIPDGAQAISDDPGLVWRAGRRTPDDLVDTSQLRIDTGRITTASLADAADDPAVCAFVVWSSRFGDLEGLEPALARVGYEREATYDEDHRALYLKRDCQPPS